MVPAVTRVLGRAFDPSRSYTMGRAWKLAVLARFQVEVQDRSVAWTGPHSRWNSWQPEATSLANNRRRSPQQAESLATAGGQI